MEKKLPQWSKDVRKAAIDKDMTIKQLAERIGYSVTTVSSVINGRYSISSYQKIAEKINQVLGTEGLPKRIDAPSDDWCQAVKIELLKRHMSISQLAERLDISRDRLSLVVNGKMMNKKIVEDVNSLLGITVPVVPSGND